MDKVLIGIPTTATVPVELVNMLLDADKPDVWDKKIVKGSIIANNRDAIVKHAINSGFTHVMFIDTDIVFPKDGIKRLLAHNTDICSGLYFTKEYGNCKPCAWNNVRFKPNGDIKAADIIKSIPTYEPVDLVGMGFCLIKTKVFEDVLLKFGCVFRHGYGAGEDFSFLIRASECGYHTMLDGTIQCGHIGQYIYTCKDWENNKE